MGFAANDLPRSSRRRTPEGIDVVGGIPYVNDGDRFHFLDFYAPTQVDGARRPLPAYIDIHGGGFTYGYKELNKNFCVNLAAQGFAVFSLNYRLMPAAGFREQLSDVCAALTWISEHIEDYPVDPHAVFVTGDSAGATIGLYILALAADPSMRKAFGIGDHAGHSGKWYPRELRGAAFISGFFDFGQVMELTEETSPLPRTAAIRDRFVHGLAGTVPEKYWGIEGLLDAVSPPPLYLTTCSDDPLEAESLFLAGHLARYGCTFQIDDQVPAPGTELGHVYPVSRTWLPESQDVLHQMKEFAARVLGA